MPLETQQGEVRFLADLEVGVDLPVAGLGSRALAQIVDGTILVGIWIVLFFSAAVTSLLSQSGATFFVLLVVGQFLLNWGWFFGWELLYGGQTPGKKLVGLRVVHTDGTNLAFTACLVRNLLRIVDFLPFFYGIGTLAIVATRRSQRLGDLAAGTVVVREERQAAAAAALRWPERMSAEDVAIVEAFFREAPLLLPERREALAAQIVALLRRQHPGFLATGQGLSHWETVEQSFRGGASGRIPETPH